jgi:glycosyltransferase involved in cell wall biosynthesis
MKDKISVALTTCNGEKFLREQLDSLYNQTIVPDEIVVVDDCSNDKTVEILEEYKQKYGLIYCVNRANLGVNKNFEKAISLCTGDYIAICDQDDVWFIEKIEKSYLKMKAIEKNGLPSLVTSHRIDVDANCKILKTPRKKPDTDSYIVTLLGHSMQGCSLMMNRKLVEYILPLPSNRSNMYDVYIGLTAAMIGNKYNISEPLMFYRHHNNNVIGRINGIESLYKIRSIFSEYCNFFSLVRFNNMRLVKEIHGYNFIDERNILYDKILNMIQEPALIKKINLLFRCSEIAFPQKVFVLLKVLMRKS